MALNKTTEVAPKAFTLAALFSKYNESSNGHLFLVPPLFIRNFFSMLF